MGSTRLKKGENEDEFALRHEEIIKLILKRLAVKRGTLKGRARLNK